MSNTIRNLLASAIVFFTCACVCAYSSCVPAHRKRPAHAFRSVADTLSVVFEAQHDLGDSLTVYFRQNISDFEPDFKQNGSRCEAFIERLDRMRTSDSVKVTKVHIYSSASPEGRESLNENLARKRAESVLAHLHHLLAFDDSLVTVTPITEDWKTLESVIESDPDVPSKRQALEIIRDGSGSDRESRMMALEDGRTWNYIYEKYFPQLRAFRVYIYIGIPQPEPEIEPEAAPQVAQPEPAQASIETLPEPQEPAVQDDPIIVPAWNRQITLKTNIVGWAMLGANISIEADLIPHLSLAIPFHYSGGLDYFKETIKFRGIVLQPELRWYPWLGSTCKNDGFYIGAHFGLGWYNFALDGEWRYQDHKGQTPAYGGGLSLGYAAQFRKHPRWGMEFGVGGGAYKANYDMFFNEHNGPYYDQGLETLWFGVDNVTLSFTYKFDLKRKGGKK